MRAAGRTGGLAVAIGAALLAACPPVRLSAQLWRPDDRVLLTDFAVVTAIAASPLVVYAATPRGLLVYDRHARAWRPPVTGLDGYPRSRITVALADVVGDAVWFGTVDGWARYDASLRLWESGFIPGGVRDLALDADDLASGVFVRAAPAAPWLFLARGAAVAVPGRPPPPVGRRIAPLTPREALGRTPAADAMRALILTDRRLRTHEFTAAAAVPDQSDVFFGTSGMGVIRVDALTGEWEALPYGLPAPAAGAVAAGVGGVWVAARARPGEPGGIVWVRDDLAQVVSADRPGALGPPFHQGRRLLARQGDLWAATERGVVRVDPRTLATRVFSLGPGLPDDDVRSLAPAPDGVWVGTARGVALITDAGEVVRSGAFSAPVLALAVRRDTLWVGSAAGLGVLGSGDAAPAVPPGVAATPALRDAIVALTLSADTLVAATADQLAWRDPATGAWTVTRPLADLGTITVLAGDEGGAWVGGTGGLALWDIGRATFRTLHVPLDLPAAVRDVAVAGTWLWVATDSGLVRLRRSAARAR